ncbi:hypothetical protein Patl1_15150 [Pistacia atlantica]|uniref:Uncharacterized protein n=1 Tax=Pistacia atlantica TaxID=434234 RepID=A0ACC1B6J3_9ROSI|nr:hypothetical protein Patl1_15150 [Pistacia atlantica]
MRRRESSTLSNILFSMFIFLFISEVQARKQEPVCSSSCGDIKNITYPFHLKGDQAGCGQPNFELTCESTKTILQSGSGKYYVKEIFYDGQIIKVVDVNLANGNCGALPSRRLSLYETLNYDDRDKMGLVIKHVSFTGRKVRHYAETKFLNCSGYFSSPASKRVPCLSGNQSYFVNYHDRLKSYGQESCSVISSVPTLVAFEKNPSYETIQKLLQSGFDLQWFDSSCYPYRGYGSIVDYFGLIQQTIWFYCYHKSFAGSPFFLGRYMFATFLYLFQFDSVYYLENWTEYTFDSLLVCFLLGNSILICGLPVIFALNLNQKP